MFQTKFDREKQQWTGARLPPLFNPEISIGQVILRSLAMNGDKLAQVCEKELK